MYIQCSLDRSRKFSFGWLDGYSINNDFADRKALIFILLKTRIIQNKKARSSNNIIRKSDFKFYVFSFFTKELTTENKLIPE